MKRFKLLVVALLLFTTSKATDTTHIVKARNNAIASVCSLSVGTYLAYSGAVSQDTDATTAGYLLMTTGVIFSTVSIFHYNAHYTNVRLTASTLSVSIKF